MKIGRAQPVLPTLGQPEVLRRTRREEFGRNVNVSDPGDVCCVAPASRLSNYLAEPLDA